MAIRHEPTRAAGALPVVAWASTATAIVGIWLSVLLAGTYAPDFVSGSQQEHLALVGAADWVWGLVATEFVVLAALQGFRHRTANPALWWGLGVGVLATWLVVLWISVTAPVMVTGSDPTRIPLAALGIPIVGVFVTWFICTLVRAAFEPEA